MIDFWSLTPEEIKHGLVIANYPYLATPTDPLIEFVYNPKLQTLASLWVECNQDKTLMRLQYFDFIVKLKSDVIIANGFA